MKLVEVFLSLEYQHVESLSQSAAYKVDEAKQRDDVAALGAEGSPAASVNDPHSKPYDRLLISGICRRI